MRGTYQDEERQAVAPVFDDEEQERQAGLLGLLVVAGLLVAVGVFWGWWTLGVILAILVMIVLHELGHYLTAKWAGMKVTEFFVGFGPRIWSVRKGETEYGLKAIPAGAYVKIIGMSNLDEVDPADEQRTYRAKPYWRRLSVAVAGSTMHFLLAFALIATVFIGFGREGDASSTKWSLGSVSGPAAAAGLQVGDRVVSVDGTAVGSFTDLSKLIRRHPGDEVAIVVRRDGLERTISATLARENPGTGQKVGYLGVSPDIDRVRSGLVEGVGDSLRTMGTATKETFSGLGRLFSPSGVSRYVDTLTTTSSSGGGNGSGAANADRPTSVVGIVQVGKQAAQNGIADLLVLLFVVNMFIGIFNLTPLLPFDGGHVVVATYEKVRSMISGRRYQADVAKLLPLTYAVVLVLAFLFITTMYLDIFHPVKLGG
jgi:membrane-associated protease RseP (regulator of RpoE activity)